jgi:hypothetical protein
MTSTIKGKGPISYMDLSLILDAPTAKLEALRFSGKLEPDWQSAVELELEARENSRTGRVSYAVGLHDKWIRAEKKMEKLQAEIGGLIIGFTPEEKAEFVRLTTPTPHVEGCKCKECII